MNIYITAAIALGWFSCATHAAESIVEQRVWTEDYEVSATTPRLVIDNIWGNVQVRAGASGQISVTIVERRSAPSQALFDHSLESLKLGIEADSSGVSMLVGGPRREWRGLDPCPGCRVDYQFEVLVPPGTQLDLGTVIDGRVDVAGVTGAVTARNVNGPISINNMHDCQAVESVNGSIELNFALAPGSDCNIETINGDISLDVPDDADMDVALDIFNGRLISELQVASLELPARIEQELGDGHNHYRIEKSTGLRLGDGGPLFSISSLNGDIRIQ